MKKSLYLTLALVIISSFTIAQEEKKDDKEKDEKAIQLSGFFFCILNAANHFNFYIFLRRFT